MSSRGRALTILAALAVAVLAAWAGFALWQSRGPSAPVRKLLALSLPDPAGASQAIAQWRGKVLVVNYWATWCEPCREEIPGLQRIREKYASKNVEVVGIAVDSASKVKDYAKSMNIRYPLLVGGLESIELARELGNKAGVLPFTIVLDSQSDIALSHLGLIKEQDLDKKLAELAR